MSATYTDLSVTSTATINNVNATTINSTTLTASDSTITNLITDTIVSGSSGTVNIGDSNDLINIEGSTINIGITGGTVNLLGTTTYIDTTNTNIKDNLITINSGGWDATCIGSGIEHSGSLGVIKASLKLDNNLDYIISSPNNKLTVDNLSTTNITGVSSISSTSATLNTLVVNGYAQLKGDVLLGDSAVDTLTVNATSNFENSVSIYDDLTVNGITNMNSNANIAGASAALTLKSTSGSGTVQQQITFNTHQNNRGGGLFWTQPDTNIKQFFGRPYNGGSATNGLYYNTTTTNEDITRVGATTKFSLLDNGNVSCANMSCSSLTGTIATASQPNITSLGTLSSLNVSENIDVGTAGTSIHNINSLRTYLNSTDVFLGGNNSTTDGILKYTKSAGKNYLQSSLSAVSGNVAPLLIGPYASGDTWAEFASTLVNIKKPLTSSSNLTVLGSSTQQAITCTTLNASSGITGTLQTASQPNITSVGTLSSLTVSGATNATLSTAAQPNITSLGTLTALNVTSGATITQGTTTKYFGALNFGLVTATGTYTIPADIYRIKITCIGGGGGGTNNSAGGSGGGGGAGSIKYLSVTPSTNITIVIGAGGTVGVAGGTTTATYNSVIVCSALGGSGASTTNSAIAGAGGANTGVGDIKVTGNGGASGSSGSTFAQAGGMSAFGFGGGGFGALNNLAGAGGLYGGGGGSYNSGANGVVVIEF